MKAAVMMKAAALMKAVAKAEAMEAGLMEAAMEATRQS